MLNYERKIAKSLLESLLGKRRKSSRENTGNTALQIERLEPRMMLNSDNCEVLFRAGFEDADVAAGQFAFFQTVSGFTATGSGVEIQNNHPAVGSASEGQRHLELDGNNGIFVNIDDIQASGLTLELDYSARGGASLQENEIDVLWNGSVVETLSADGAAVGSTDFNRFTIDLPIDGGSTAGRLEFRSRFGGSRGLGGLLDNIVVSAELSPIAIGDIPDQEVQRGGTLNVDADLLPLDQNATDTNFQLIRGPVGATVDPNTGEFQFVATEENILATENRESETVIGPPQVIVFAGFEDVEVSSRQFDFFESTSGFDATGRVVEVQENHPAVGPASQGNNLVELDGQNGIARTIATQQGDQYELNFDFSPRPGVDAATNAIDILWDGEVIQSVTDDGTNNQTTNFRTVTINLSQFSGDSTRLEFRSQSVGTAPGFGGLIDNVRVTRREVSAVSADNPFEVIIRATDSNGRTDDERFNITINDQAVNQAPVFDPIEELTINERESVSFQLTATDADTPASELRYEAIRIPVSATLDPVTGLFEWTTDEFSGDRFFNIDVRVTDSDGLSDERRFRITVNEVNSDPNIVAIEDLSLGQDQPLSLQVNATDSDRPVTGPVDVLSYSLINPPAGATISATGEISWTPTAAQLGSDDPFEFTVQVTDESGGSATESFTVTIDNQSPVLDFIENRQIDELETVEVQLTASDPNGNGNDDDLVFELVNGPVGSTLDPATGLFVWTPNEFAGGFDFFNVDVRVTDAEGFSDSQRFRVVVIETNTIPVLQSINDVSIDAGESVSIQTVATDSDVPTDTLSFTLTESPAGATISDEGLILWTPEATVTEGTFEFTVRVSDGNGGSATESFTVTVVNPIDTITLVENDDFLSTQSRAITVGPDVNSVSFQFTPEFDTEADFVNDAFEVALVDSEGQSLLHTFNQDRDAFFNLTEGEDSVASVNTIQTGDTVTVDLSHIAEGTVANLVFRLVNNDGDTQSRVTITNIETSANEIDTPLGTTFAPSPAPLLPVDLTLLQDVTESFTASFGQTSFNEQSDALFTNITLTNVGQVAISGRTIAVLGNVSDEQIALIQPDGRLADGRFYIDVTPDANQIAHGETARTRDFQLFNEANETFQFELTLLAEINSAPTGFVSTPPEIVEAGTELFYTAVAIDPDEGQVLRYNIIRGNEGITINEETGVLRWTTAAGDIGNNRITVRATDPFGLFTEQTFNVEVVESLQNRPPVFTTDPVTTATASSGFEVTTLATGDNPNGVGVISGFEGPRIVTINPDDQTVGVHEGTGNDRFDDETVFSTGEPERTGNAIQSGFTIDVGLPAFLNSSDENDIFGLDQADFNGDGILDLASLTYHRSNIIQDGFFHTVVINFGDGNGDFGEPVIVEQFNFGGKVDFENLTVADINNDGNADLLWNFYQQFSNSDQSLFYTMIGNGDGTFEPAVLAIEGVGLGDFRVVDLDQDGNVDVVGRRQFTDDIGWRKGNGDGTFDEFSSLSPDDTFGPTQRNRSRSFQIVDLDGDGDLDIVQARQTSRGIQILTNDGNLNFTETDVLGTFSSSSFYESLQVADFTGDGFVDLFFALPGQLRDFRLLRGTADGFEETSVSASVGDASLSSPGNPAGDGLPVDIDGDGDLDLLLGHVDNFGSRNDGARVLLNDGTGFFSNVGYSAVVDSNGQPNQDNQSNFAFTGGVLAGDYNSDGVLDLAVYTGGVGSFGLGDFNSVSVLLGTSPGEFAAVRTLGDVMQVAGDVEVVPGDFNNDGLTDLLTLGGGMIELGQSDGTFAEPFQATPGRVGDHAVLTDFNNDGIIDLLLAAGGRGSGTSAGFHQVLLGNGDGTFEQSFLERDDGGGFGAASVADFNNDGFQDFVTKSTLGGIVEVLLNDPTNPGTFTDSFGLDLEQNFGFSLDVGDFDEDGNIDFVTIQGVTIPGTDPTLQTYQGQGDGTFELINEQAGLFGVSNIEENSHAGDVDNDGHLDFVTFSNAGTLVHLGNGDGSFANPIFVYADSPTRLFRTRQTELVDFDEDGNLDLIFVHDSVVLSFQKGLGDGTFAVAERYRFSNSSGVPYIADIDNDGHLDITLRPGTGNAAFSSQINALFGVRDGLVDLLTVDLNGDGNEEVLAINEDNDRLKIFVGDNLGGLTRLNDVLVGRAPRAVAAADLDGDGTQELITANRAGRSISVLTGDVESGYTVTDFDVDGAPVDVEVTDLDRDGNIDIVVLDEFNNALWVFAGNGTTTLDAPTPIALGDVASRFILADATGDGEIDAVVTLPETNRVLILGGIGGATVDAPIFVTTESAPSDVAVVDLNDDGNADLAITLPESGVLSVHYGLGNNQFARAQQITVGDTPTRVTAADADEDGRIDLIVTNSGDNTASVIFNRFDPNEVYRYDADVTDPDGDSIEYRVVDGPGGLFVDAATGEIIWAASPGQVGQHTVILEANDGNGGIATQQFVIDVQPSTENSAPLIATEPVATIGANDSFEYQVSSIDDDNDSLRYRIINGPEGATIDPVTGLLQWDGRTDGAVQLAPFGALSTGNIEIDADASLQPESITVEGWYNFHELTATNGRMILIAQEGQLRTGRQTTYSLHINGNRDLVLQLDTEDGPFELATPFVAETDRWYHFAFTFDDTTREAMVYVDGVAVVSGISNSRLLYDASRDSQVGEFTRFGTFATIDNYRIWNEVRSESQIQEGLTRQFNDNPAIVLDYRFESDNTISVFDNSSYNNTGFLTPVGTRPIPAPGLANAGIHSFTIGVEDGRGGMTTQTFDVEIVAELRGAISGTIVDESTGDGLPDWLVFLDSNDNQFADPDELQTTTDADGNYEFDGLLPGDYPVRVAPAAGFQEVGLQNANVVANENTVNDVVARQLELSQIQGQLTTTDGDSISHWTIFADLDNDGVRDSDEPAATTDLDGFFAIAGLDAGEFNLRADLPAGWAVDGGNSLIVNLAEDTVSTGNDFVVAPTNTSVTGGVHFVTTAPAEVAARNVFRYASVATGIANQAITYDISLAPDGLSIDPNTGQVAWQPTIEQLGEQLIILRATDDSGSVALQSFTVVVTAPNTAPVITSDAPTLSFVGLAFAYDVIAQDAEQNDLTYAILSGGDGATIDDQGRLLWTPATGDVGSVDFEIEVRDSAGNSTTQLFTVTVSSDQPAATPFVITTPRTEVGLGQRYFARVSGVDQLDRALEWSLVAGPTGLTVDADGILSWNPGTSDLGDQTIELLATNADGETESYEFVLSVVGRPVIQAPVIESAPLLSSVIGNEYQYDVVATDPDGDVLSFALLDAPQGASIDASRGTIRWTPQADQLGESEITVQVTDPDGATDTQTFTLRVSRAGGPPIITSTPTTEVNVGGSFLYSVVARDAEGDPLTYRLLDAPEGATISETTGELSWTPTANQVGQQTIIIEVADGFGGASTQAFSVLVGDGVVNLPPQIESEAPRFAAVGSDYQYQITANDPEGTSLSYSIGQGPAGLSVDADGLVTWTPAAGQVGQFVVTLIVTDANGASAIESFELDVLAANNAPVINSFAPADHFAGEEFLYDVLVNDADFDPLRFELVNGPAGATIDAFGRLRWATNNDLIGTHDFEILVTDPRGGEATQSFTLNVVEDTAAPTLLLTDLNNETNRNIFPWQSPLRVFARASDNVGVASLTLTANGEDVPLDANGQAAFEFADFQFSNINVVATATDVNGNVTTRSIDIDFDFPEGFTGEDGQTLPTAVISSPTLAETVTGFVTITGTADADSFAGYELQIRRADQPESAFETIVSGDTAVVNGELGVWDTSLLRNDEYVIRLAVADTDGVVNITEQNVGLSGDLKFGNFQLQFIDLVIPVVGIPVQVTRVYDTLDANIEGEFGSGFRLEFRDTDLQVGLPESGLEDIGIHTALRPGTKVYLNLPGEGRVGFTFDPEIRVLPGFGGENLVVARPRFTADPGVTATLDAGVSGFVSVNEFGELIGPGNIPYNPASPDFGGAYILNNNGISYRIDGVTGQLESATDRNGNTLTFSDQGILSESGVGIEFERDAAGRITRITDPNENSVQYQYSDGRLASSSDQLGNVTRYTYDPAQNNFLSEVIDPLGRVGSRSEYDADGRLISFTGADGRQIELNRDLDSLQEILTDGNGNTTVIEADNRGNVLSVTDALGGVASNVYDDAGNQISSTNQEGETTTRRFDARGNVISVTDPTGATTSFTYNSLNEVAFSTDSLGHTTIFEYDDSGNLVRFTSPDGGSIESTHDDVGNVVSVTDADGNTTRFEYDSAGFVTAEIDALGQRTIFTNDANGNQLTTTDALGNIGSATYDARGNLTSFTNPLGEVTEFIYDSAGNLITQTDALDNVTGSEFDGVGNVTRLVDANGFGVEFEYDALNNQTAITDELGQTTQYEYDALARRTGVTNPAGDTVEVEYDRAGRVTLRRDSLGNETTFAYDAAGRNISSTDPFGNVTQFQYDSSGNLTAEIDPEGNVTRFIYDELNRLVGTEAADGSTETRVYDLVGNLSQVVDGLDNATNFEYDANGNLLQVLDSTGATTTYEYNANDQLVRQIDALGRTTEYRYDENGRQIAKVYPDGTVKTRTFDAVNRVATVTDASGDTTTITTDGNGNVTQREFEDGSSESFTYTPTGNLETSTNAAGTTSYQYDSLDRLVSVTYPDDSTVSYQYDSNGNRTSVETSIGNQAASTTRYSFDDLGRINVITSPDGEQTEYTYDSRGNLETVSYPNGVVSTYTYNSVNRVSTLTTVSGAEVLESYTYTYSALGDRTRTVELDGSSVDYTYDSNRRLLSETRRDATGAIIDSLQYEYDAVGNRVATVDETGSRLVYQYNVNDQLLSFGDTTLGYDLDGNLISRTDADGTTTYQFDFEDQLISVTSPEGEVSYEYDASGERLSRTAEDGQINFLVDPVDPSGVSQVLVEYTADGTEVAQYTFGLQLISQERDGVDSYFHLDANDNVRFLTSATGEVTDQYAYTAFGQSLESSGSTENPYRFAGQRAGGTEGVSFFRARYYDADTGRFISRDPFQGVLNDPVTRHRYLYANGNPISFRDPTGLFSLAELGTASSILSTIQVNYTSALTNTLISAANTANEFILVGAKGRELVFDALSRGVFTPGLFRILQESNDTIAQGFNLIRQNAAKELVNFGFSLFGPGSTLEGDFRGFRFQINLSAIAGAVTTGGGPSAAVPSFPQLNALANLVRATAAATESALQGNSAQGAAASQIPGLINDLVNGV